MKQVKEKKMNEGMERKSKHLSALKDRWRHWWRL